jgi:hypothetical protein
MLMVVLKWTDGYRKQMRKKIRESQWDRNGVIAEMLKDTPIPRMARVLQKFQNEKISDIPAAVYREVGKRRISERITSGSRIAITVGSRGIANIDVLVRSLVAATRRHGGNPFIVPAMGSHGGATARGQIEVLASMHITEDTVGAPIHSTMDTVVVGNIENGKPVYMNRAAADADGIVVFGRVKLHTSFRGPYESGLLKMLAIGLGSQRGADAVHSEGFGKMAQYIGAYGKAVLDSGRILFGLAVVENAFDDTCRIHALVPNEIPKIEPELLRDAKMLMPSILFDNIDVLIVDQIGKNFSGDGMDPNITGSYATPCATGGPEIERYVVLDLSNESHGNAIGIGMADFTTKRAFDKVDFDTTYPNALTSRIVNVAKIPLVVQNNRLAIQAAIYALTGANKDTPRIVRINTTSKIHEIQISDALLIEAGRNSRIEVVDQPRSLVFDTAGNLF